MVKIMKHIDMVLLSHFLERSDLVYTAYRTIFGRWRGSLIINLENTERLAWTSNGYPDKESAINALREGLANVCNS